MWERSQNGKSALQSLIIAALTYCTQHCTPDTILRVLPGFTSFIFTVLLEVGNAALAAAIAQALNHHNSVFLLLFKELSKILSVLGTEGQLVVHINAI